MDSALYTLLSTDTTLLATLTGGFFDSAKVGVLSKKQTPTAFDADGGIKPSGLFRVTADIAIPDLNTSARREFTVYLYQRKYRTSAIATAQSRIYTLLHRQYIRPLSGGAWQVQHATTVFNLDDTLLDASLILMRFNAWVLH